MNLIEETDSNIIVFDTDFLIANAKSLVDILKKISTKYVCYIPQICIDEFCAKKYNDSITEIRNFKNNLKSYDKLGIVFNKSEEECKEIIKGQTSTYLKNIFSEKVICFHNYPLKKIINRAYDKKAPFGASDSGFKDTLILLNIVDFIKGKNIQKIKFITNDKDFLLENVKKEIIEEIREETGCILDIVDGKNAIAKLYNYLKIDDELEEEIFAEQSNNILNVSELRENLNDLCNNIFYYEAKSVYDTYYKSSFYISKLFDKNNIETFLKNIPVVLNENIFSQYLKMSDFFDNTNDFREEQPIAINNFEELYKIYKVILKQNSQISAFYNFLLKKFNNNYKCDIDDLPF